MFSRASGRQVLVFSILIWFISALFYFHQYFLRVSLSAFGLQIIHNFNITPFTLSSIAASFFYTFVVTQLVAGMLVDRYGPRRMLSLAAFICSIGALLFAESKDITWLYASRCLMGAGAAFALIGTLTVASQWFSEEAFILINGLTTLVGVMGAYLGEGPLASLLSHEDWRHVMFVCAIFSFIIAALIYTAVRSPEGALQKQETTAMRKVLEHFWRLLKSPRFMLICCFIGLGNVTIDSLGGLWLQPFLIAKYHVSNAVAGQVSSLQYIGFGIGSMAFSYLLSRDIKWLKTLMLIGMSIAIISLALLVYTELGMVLLSALNFTLGFSLGVTCLGFVMIRESIEFHVIGMAYSIAELFKHLFSAVILQLLGLMLTEHMTKHIKLTHNPKLSLSLKTYHHSFALVLACVVIGFVIALVLSKRKEATLEQVV